ncbi:general odorant-binding protein 19d-like [Rhagoletis pomonella]|uniref:general odorant-binding protein 19d-like n=1 Tax=Rhagoletis pomonella TaxID=28610 RepID=UPI001786CDFE|nr:general odorant-binding protein 19d-like [Rhagoletis pomonella]
MRVLSVLTICLAISLLPVSMLADPPPPPHYDSLRTMAEAAVEDCYEDADQSVKVEITDEGFDELLRGSRDNLLRNTKCLRYCIMRKNGLINAGNSIDEDRVVEIFEIIHPQIEKEKLIKVLQKCSDETEKQIDNCERAFAAATCVLGELKGQGVTDI